MAQFLLNHLTDVVLNVTGLLYDRLIEFTTFCHATSITLWDDDLSNDRGSDWSHHRQHRQL